MTLNLLQHDFQRDSGTIRVLKSLDRGLKTEAIEKIASYLGISVNEFIGYLRISRSTWQRRKKTGMLDYDLSDRVLQLSTLLDQAENVFGDEIKVRQWFLLPSIVFEGKRPVELIGSLSGMNLIGDELMRIEQGVYI